MDIKGAEWQNFNYILKLYAQKKIKQNIENNLLKQQGTWPSRKSKLDCIL